MNPTVVLDENDELNYLDGYKPYIDRHDCAAMDVNDDGVHDLL
jgi:hypothetical protein